MITGDQVRAARELLGWSQVELAARIGVSETTIGDFEKRNRIWPVLNLSALRQVLKSAGVEFTEGASEVKLKADSGSIRASWEPQTD
jgi:transcriptional regulator with XRE-family HTH domain